MRLAPDVGAGCSASSIAVALLRLLSRTCVCKSLLMPLIVIRYWSIAGAVIQIVSSSVLDMPIKFIHAFRIAAAVKCGSSPNFVICLQLVCIIMRLRYVVVESGLLFAAFVLTCHARVV